MNQKEITIAKVVYITNELLRSSVLKNDENLILTIKQIKEAIKNAIDPNTIKISVLESKRAQNINEVAHLQVFFTILTDDVYLAKLHNSKVIKQIVQDLIQSTKTNIIEQFYINLKVKTKVKVKLINLLKNKYNYPPKHLGGISGILINKINKAISINPKYNIKKEIK